MAQVTISLNGYRYTVGCKDGQENHLLEMVKTVEEHIDMVRALGGQSGEGRMLALASILMADKLYELRKNIESLQQDNFVESLKLLENENNFLKNQLQEFADRAEAIAGKLEVS